jgi:hypothetical protein
MVHVFWMMRILSLRYATLLLYENYLPHCIHKNKINYVHLLTIFVHNLLMIDLLHALI